MTVAMTSLDTSLDLSTDVVSLTEQLVDIESVSRNEEAIADAVQAALEPLPHLTVTRHGHTVVARTDLGRSERVVIAGHLDTVPVNDNFPSRREGDLLHGLGTCDMKGGDAVILRMAATVPEPVRDVTYILYEAEEIDAEFNGLHLLAQSDPDLMVADFAILMEPSNAVVEAGCQGTMRVDVRTTGERAHSARGLARGQRDPRGRGGAAPAQRVRRPPPGHRRAGVPRGAERGLHPRRGGRQRAARTSASSRSTSASRPTARRAQAEAYVRDFFDGFDVRVTDTSPGRCRAWTARRRKAFIEAVGGEVNPKFGWTDVARFTALGVPAVNFGPGDPMLAHKQEEHVPVEQIERCESQLRAWLTGTTAGAGA